MLYLKIEQCLLGDSGHSGLAPGLTPPVLPGLSSACISYIWCTTKKKCHFSEVSFIIMESNENKKITIKIKLQKFCIQIPNDYNFSREKTQVLNINYLSICDYNINSIIRM